MASRPVIPKAEVIYNSLMKEIEPELLTSSIPTLEKKYADETEAERARRTKRYKEAYKKYDKAYAKYIKGLTKQVQAYKKDAMKTAESKNREKEQSILKKLEQSFS